MPESRHPSDVAVETTHLVLPADTNPHGTALGGRIMEWTDICAGICAERYSRAPVVAAAVDDLCSAQPHGEIVI